MSAGVALSAADVAQLRAYLAAEADEQSTDDDRRAARMHLVGYLAAALDAAPAAEVDHLDRAADLVLSVIATRDPGYPVRPEVHDALVDLLESVVSALLVGRRDR